MKVLVKYFRGSEKVTEHTYTDVESWKVVGGKEAEEVEKEFIGNDLDEFQEYLILSFADGTTATFRPFQNILITSCPSGTTGRKDRLT